MKAFENICDRPRNTNILLIVDLNNILYKSLYVYPNLTTKCNGKIIYTGGLYGVINQIKFAIKRFNANSILICLDNPPYIRTEILHNYKSNRNVDSAIKVKVEASRTLINQFFLELRVNIWSVPGMEADDLIYAVCSKSQYDKIVVLSNDKDLYQVFAENKNVYMIRKDRLYGIKNFLEEYNINPWRWAWFNALSGGHNGLPGFERVGEKRGIEIAKRIPKEWRHIKPPLELSSREQKLIGTIDYVKLRLYYTLSKLPLFGHVMLWEHLPKLSVPNKQSLKAASKFLKKLNFKEEEKEGAHEQ